MNIPWEISGHDGYAYTGERRTLAAAGVADGVLKYDSLEIDELSWNQQRGTVPPAAMQPITLWRDGVRVFRGHVTTRPYIYQAGSGADYKVQCVGPGWWLAKTKINGEVTDAEGKTVTRPQFRFPLQDLKISVRSLIDRAEEIGLPIRVGEIDPMFEIQQRTFTSGSFLAVLVDLLRPMPDACSWIDYDAPGLPALNIVRRGKTMKPVTIEIGVDDVQRIELTPRIELRPSGVAVTTATRDAKGKVVFTTTQAGGVTSQLVAISGPEILPYEIPDNLPKMELQTVPVAGSFAEASVLDSVIAQAIADHGSIGANPAGGTYQLYQNGSGGGGINYFTAAPVVLMDAKTGAPPVGTWHRLTTGTVVDFLRLDYGLMEKGLKVVGEFIVETLGWDNQPAVLEALREAGKARKISGYKDQSGSVTFPSTDKRTIWLIRVDYSLDAISIPNAGGIPTSGYPVLQTVYAKAAFDYLQAPAGLAQNLFEAQNWIPYEGSLSLNPGMPWRRWTACRLNVRGGDPDLESAGALIQSQTTYLVTGATEIRCGAPSRVAMDEVAGKFTAANPDDAIFTLT